MTGAKQLIHRFITPGQRGVGTALNQSPGHGNPVITRRGIGGHEMKDAHPVCAKPIEIVAILLEDREALREVDHHTQGGKSRALILNVRDRDIPRNGLQSGTQSLCVFLADSLGDGVTECLGLLGGNRRGRLGGGLRGRLGLLGKAGGGGKQNCRKNGECALHRVRSP